MDQRAANSPVAVGKRVQRFKLSVGNPGLDERTAGSAVEERNEVFECRY